jgi:hypothetical protein
MRGKKMVGCVTVAEALQPSVNRSREPGHLFAPIFLPPALRDPGCGLGGSVRVRTAGLFAHIGESLGPS